jgi:hypothetical protein
MLIIRPAAPYGIPPPEETEQISRGTHKEQTSNSIPPAPNHTTVYKVRSKTKEKQK